MSASLKLQQAVTRKTQVTLHCASDQLMQNQVKKTSSTHLKTGSNGEQLLVHGHKIALRRWHEGAKRSNQSASSEPYEIVGYLISGSFTINVDGGEDLVLQAGDSWSIPAGVSHSYDIRQDIEVIEAITV